MGEFQEYVNTHRDRFAAELQDACRQPSIAAQNVGMREMAPSSLCCVQKAQNRTHDKQRNTRKFGHSRIELV